MPASLPHQLNAAGADGWRVTEVRGFPYGGYVAARVPQAADASLRGRLRRLPEAATHPRPSYVDFPDGCRACKGQRRIPASSCADFPGGMP